MKKELDVLDLLIIREKRKKWIRDKAKVALWLLVVIAIALLLFTRKVIAI